MQVISYTKLRSGLKDIMAQVFDSHEPAVITRPKEEHMVLLSLKDYEALKETAYLLGTEANAIHLRQSLKSARAGKLTQHKLIEE